MQEHEESRHLYFLTWSANPVMLHVICLVIIMQMVTGAALADLYYIASSRSAIHSPTPGADGSRGKEETE